MRWYVEHGNKADREYWYKAFLYQNTILQVCIKYKLCLKEKFTEDVPYFSSMYCTFLSTNKLFLYLDETFINRLSRGRAGWPAGPLNIVGNSNRFDKFTQLILNSNIFIELHFILLQYSD